MSDGSNASNSGARAVGGVFKTVHGIGEAIRGNINSFADSAGERIAGRNGTVPTSASGERSTTVAQQGATEFKEGMADLRGGSTNAATAPTATTTTTAAVPQTGAHTTAAPTATTSEYAGGKVQAQAPAAAPMTSRGHP